MTWRPKGVEPTVQLEVFSDIVCPWCYIGKRHMEAALADFPHADSVEVTYRSFQLDPTTPKDATGTTTEYLAAKYGVSEDKARQMNERVTAVAADAGLDYRLEDAHPANTFDSHRLLHFAATQGKQAELKERLMAAYFMEGVLLGDAEALVALAGEVGLDTDAARAVLAGDDFTEQVHADLSMARTFGVSGVPFFVIDRKYGISGAQPAAVIRQALDQAWLEANPLTMVTAPAADGTSATDTGTGAEAVDGDHCADGVCAI